MYTYDECFNASLDYFNGDDLAAKVFVDKYALQDNEGNYLEKTPDQMHRRLAREFARIEANKFKNPLSEDMIYELFDRFQYIVPQGSPMYGIGNDYTYQSLGNCFTLGQHPYDSYGGILYADQIIAQLCKRRCGIGLRLDKIRPKGLSTKNAAKTTDGIAVFMERFSNTIREVAQNGRRGAGLQCLSVHHPEIETFINIKKDLTKVTGANISVVLTDEFMWAVKNKTTYEQRWPVNSDSPEISREVNAVDIWNQIIEAAHTSAEPGLLFEDSFKEWSMSDAYGKVDSRFEDVTPNPCLTGDSLVYVADGRGNVPIKQLAEEQVDVPVFCFDADGKIVLSTMRRPRKTGVNIDVYELELSNGLKIKATKNHKFLHSSGQYVDIENLKINEKIISYNLSENVFNEINIVYNNTPPSTSTHKNCEICNKTFSPIYELREACFCSQECIEKYKAINPTVKFNDLYQQYCTIKSISYIGTQDVYNGTVDNYHNFFVGGFESEQENGKKQWVYLNNRQCGEIIMGEDSCRLMLVNLFSYVVNPFTDQAQFDYNLLVEHTQIAQRLMDNMVDLEIEKISNIIEKVKSDPEPDYVKEAEIRIWSNYLEIAKLGRRTGLGITALGDVLAALGIRYGSKESIEITEKIYKIIGIESLRSSCEMAKELGSFPLFNKEVEKNIKFVDRLLSEDEELKKLHDKYGRRNISLTTTAPAGTVSILTQTTSGIEPAFMVEYSRRKKISGNEKYDFVDGVGDKWQTYKVYHPKYKIWKEVTGQDDFNLSPYFDATANQVDWKASVDIQAVAQKWVSHSISKTCNVPNDTSKELIAEIYMDAYDKGCKGFTVYRDGCRSGVLISSEEKDENHITKTVAPDRPTKLDCDVYFITIKGEKFFVVVGLLGGEPYEVFAGPQTVLSGSKEQKGQVQKIHNPKSYRLILDDKKIDQINEMCEDSEAAICRLTSTCLRHGVELEFIIHQLQRTKGEMTSFARSIARVIKKYVEGKESRETCPDCESKLQYSEGCLKCVSCGFSKCS